MIDVWIEEDLGARDSDVALSQELGDGYVVRTMHFFGKANCTRRSRFDGPNREFVEYWFMKKHDGQRTAQIGVNLTAEMDLALVIDRDVMPLESTLTSNALEFYPVSVK